MKKWNLSLSVLLVCQSFVWGQVPFPTQNAVWCYDGYDDSGQTLEILCVTPLDYAEINGKMYTKAEYKMFPFTDQQTIWYREEDRRFYVLPQDSVQEILVYDFSLNPGDTFSTHWGFGLDDTTHFTVIELDTITTADGKKRKQMFLSEIQGGHSGRWVEGLGSLDWVFLYPAYVFSVSGGYYFTCHKSNGDLIYPFDVLNPEAYDCKTSHTDNHQYTTSSVAIIPNPVMDVVTIRHPELKIQSVNILSLFGHTLYEKNNADGDNELSINFPWPSGIYFIRTELDNGVYSVDKVIKN